MTERATFTGVHIFVRDMAATAAFYRALGLEFEGNGQFARATAPFAAIAPNCPWQEGARSATRRSCPEP